MMNYVGLKRETRTLDMLAVISDLFALCSSLRASRSSTGSLAPTSGGFADVSLTLGVFPVVFTLLLFPAVFFFFCCSVIS